MKLKMFWATLVIIMLYILIELAYARTVLGLPWDIVIRHQLPLRGAVIACILALGWLSHRYLMAQKTRYNLHEQFELLQEAVISAVFSPAPLHVKAQNLLSSTINSLPLSYIGLVYYRPNSLELIDQQGPDTLRLANAITTETTTLHPVENLLLGFRNKKIPKHETSFKGQTLLFLSLKPAHLTQPIGVMVALFKPKVQPKDIHHDALDFLGQNAGFLLSLWSKKVTTLQSLCETEAQADEAKNSLPKGIEPYNKLQEVLLHEFKRHKRYNTGLTLLLFGIDFYDNLCNIFGKDKGEAIIRDVSILVKNNTRSTDILGLWEREIFGIVLADNTFRQATSLAKKLQGLVNKRHFGHPVSKITCSYGISTQIEGDTMETLRNRAKLALDKARTEGGDRIEVCLAGANNSAL